MADLPACAQIINDYIDSTDWLPRTKPRAEIAGLFTPELLDKRTMLVVEVDREVAAYASAADGFVYAIYIAPRHRNAGIGAKLLDELKSRYQQLELTVFELNDRARRFYDREGFSEIPERRDDNTEEGVPTLLMRWRRAA
ncbi:MAG: GNAT family N-acetyltransferase [Rhizobiaceae bacterium]|nr:GNAT family N-acetyltransferase [Rhizobiaceae bacterium]